MSDFDDLLAELKDRGLTEDDEARLRAATAASPLRKGKDAAEERAEKAEARVQVLEGRVFAGVLAEAGVTAKAEALKIPDELDVTDTAAVKKWAAEAGLAEPEPPDTNDEELDAHDRVANAGAGAESVQAGVITPEQAAGWSTERWAHFGADHPEAAEQLRRGEEVRGVAV